ncbi:MAG TPA: AbrB/MazE/SpoVT family DNA-binding domain-containing protein [Dehalococcoidia bacterium]|nr:AbrB/MazE/SpoVT family DNA-binding domain-containing protein [Dehalococcoidia bacterium]
MKEISATVTQRGQVTIPAEVRRLLGVKPGDKVAFVIEGHQVGLRPVRFTLESAFGSVKPLAKTVDFKAMIQMAKEEKVQRDLHKFQG